MTAKTPWDKYLSDTPGGLLEVVTDVLYDTSTFKAGVTKRLTFFDKPPVGDLSRCNMPIPYMLPNPCSFLIREVSIVGLPPALAYGTILLQIGNKHYGRFPLRWFVVNARGSVILNEMVMIAPMQNFRAEIEFDNQRKGFNRNVEIVVSLTGAMARPVS